MSGSGARSSVGAGAALVLTLALVSSTSGCSLFCRSGPEVLPQSSKLLTPYDTLDFLRFGIRNGAWDPLYDACTARTRQQMLKESSEGDEATGARVLFAVIFPTLTYGDYDARAPKAIYDVKIVDVLTNSSIQFVGEAWDPTTQKPFPIERVQQVSLYYEREGKDVPPELSVFLLINEGTEDEPRWALGVLETLIWLDQLGVIHLGG